MIDNATLEKALQFVRTRWKDATPKAGMILGSGWGDVVASFQVRDAIPYEEIPGLGKTGVVGHSGKLVWGDSAGVETFMFQGRRHYYEGVGWTAVALPIYLLKHMGAKVVLLTNAAGGIRKDLLPGTLMVIDDHINWMCDNPLLGPHNKEFGPRFPDMTNVYDPALRAAIDRAGKTIGEPLPHGVYLAGSGPAYETPAEIRAYTALGADAVGMSTVPEAILAKAVGLRVAGVSCITNSAAGISAQPLSHEEVTDTTTKTMARMKALLLAIWKELPREGI